MEISMIAAIGENRELGKDNRLLWHLPGDLKFFKETTMHKTILMGRKTFESLPRMLPGRHHIVLSKSKKDFPEGVEVFEDLHDFLQTYRDADEEIFVIGGGSVYSLFLPLAQTLYLTHVKAAFDADVFFPAFDPELYEIRELASHTENGLHYRHVQYIRK